MKLKKFSNPWQAFKYTKLYRLPLWVLRKMQYFNYEANKEYTLQMRLGHKMLLKPTQRYLSNILFSRQYHDADIFFVDRVVPEGGVVLDIGANIGLYTCSFANYMKTKNVEVHAIEAVKKNYHFLVKNIELNRLKNAKAHRFAFGQQEGELTFLLPAEDFVGNVAGGNMLSVDEQQKIKNAGAFEEVVPMTTLDLWTDKNQINRCDFIKIDIEGAEMLTFMGGKSFLRATRPIIQCEYNKWWLNKTNFTLEDLISYFEEMDFQVFQENGHSFSKFQKESFDSELSDFLFVPTEKISLVMS